MELKACDPDLEKTWTTTGQDDLLWQCTKPTFISSFPVKPKVKECPTVKQYYMKFPPKIVLRDFILLFFFWVGESERCYEENNIF